MFKYTYFVIVLLFCCCSSGVGDSLVVPGEEEEEGEVTVTFSTGNSSTVTRAAFPNNTPIKVYVFRRSASSTTANFSAAPYKVVEGYTSGTTGVLSNVIFNGGDITADNRLTVRTGYKYDFVAVVNATSGAKFSDMGALSSGMLTGFTHGSDILSGRKEGVPVVSDGVTKVNITFTEYGADSAGNLPHLCSAVRTEASATEELIKALNYSLSYAVAGMDFKECLPKSANLPFGGDPMALSVQASGYTTSYSVSALGTEVTVKSISDIATSGVGVILPCPPPTGKTYNTMRIDFRLRVNGGEVILSATGVQTPEFKPGYRYSFIVELDKDEEVVSGKINLLLSIEPWTSTTWQSGMGEGDTVNKLIVAVGSWTSVSWQNGMGGGDTGGMTITSVSGWRSATWTSDMGKVDVVVNE